MRRSLPLVIREPYDCILGCMGRFEKDVQSVAESSVYVAYLPESCVEECGGMWRLGAMAVALAHTETLHYRSAHGRPL